MSELAPIQINDLVVYIEVEKQYGSEDISAIDKTIEKTKDAFQYIKSTITNVAAV